MANTRGRYWLATAAASIATELVMSGQAALAQTNAGAQAAAEQPVLQEVVVTANKRVENVQDVAASVSVENGQQLIDTGKAQLADYAADMPGFNVANGGSPGQTSVSLRGISSITATSAIGTYLDDTPVGGSSAWVNASTTMLDMLPYDLDRLEVLRGPQGTLYGAGAMGGLIKYVLKTPSTTAFEANVGADMITIDGGGNIGHAVQGRVNFPVIEEVLGVSVSVFDKETPGFMTNIATGQRDTNLDQQYGARIAALWRPLSNLSVKVSALTQEIEAGDLAIKQFANSTPVPTAAGGPVVLAPAALRPDYNESFAFIAPYDQRMNYFSSTIDWSPGPFDVVSATSWSSQRSSSGGDLTPQLGAILQYLGGTGPGLVGYNLFYGLDKFTQEFRLVSPQGNPIEWLVGVFDTHENSTNNQYIAAYDFKYQPAAPAFPPGLLDAAIPEIFDEYAVFGDLTWKPVDAFKVTGGFRYAENHQNYNNTGYGPILSETGMFHVALHEGVFTWMGTAEYQFAEDTMAYARVATGYRPGGPNTPLAGVPPTFGSDSLINYELGLKSTFLDQKAQVDFALYRIDWKDIQLGAVANNVGFTANGGKAVSQGLEFASKYSPIRSLTLGINAAYTNSHLTSVNPDANYLLTGYQLPNVPKVSVSFTADYDWSLTDRWTARIGGAYRYVGPQWLAIVEQASPVTTPTVQAPGYSVLDLNASVRENHLAIKLYVRNIANKLAITAPSAQSLVMTNGATGISEINTSFLQPRTIGLGFDYAF